MATTCGQPTTLWPTHSRPDTRSAGPSVSLAISFADTEYWGDLSATFDPVRAVPVALCVHADEEIQHLADGSFPADRVPQRQVPIDAVLVAAAVLVAHHVAGGDEVANDVVGAAG